MSSSVAGASQDIRRVVDGHVFFRHMSKHAKLLLQQSLAEMAVDEELLCYGTARSIAGKGIESEGYSYYLVTDKGIYFGGAAKAGMFSKERRTAFISAQEVRTGELRGSPIRDVDMGFLECKDESVSRILWMCFDDIAGNVGSPLEQAMAVGVGLGLTF